VRGRGKPCPTIGIAGGIGAGKSAVSGIFAGYGAVTIDADAIARQVLCWPQVKARIAREFGEGVLEDGQVSRPKLANVVFADESLVKRLNAIVHPAVIDETKRMIDAARRDEACRAIVLDAPLLFEAELEGLCDYVVFVDAAEGARLERLTAGRGWEKGEMQRRERFQDSLISKRKRADYIVDNNGSLDETVRQVDSIWKAIVNG
jgi:dephospho-CoA kinase